MIEFLKNKKIQASFHYTPLHSSEYGLKSGVFRGEDKNTTSESGKLLRLPLFYSITDNEIDLVTESIKDFYES